MHSDLENKRSWSQ